LLTGVYRLDTRRSDDPRDAAERAVVNLPTSEQQQDIDNLTLRLTSPDQISIERRGRTVSLASTRAPRITFEADERDRLERAADGHTIRTRASLSGESLIVSTRGHRDDEFTITFDPIDNGRGLRVTRSIYDTQLGRPIVVQSIYTKTANVARWSVYGEPESSRASVAGNNPRVNRQPGPANTARNRPLPGPPVIRPSTPPPSQPAPAAGNSNVFQIGNGTQFVAVLNNDLSTAQSREGDAFTMTVREPAHFAGAKLEGHVASITRGGRVSGRSDITLAFDRITLADGRSAAFNGYIESVRAAGADDIRVDNEGGGQVQENNDQTNRTIERTAIGAAVGAIIGAIAGGGKGAAIGAAIGAGAGAGSVYIQGRDDLELARGTEITLRASATR
jgi:hypothetical protein